MATLGNTNTTKFLSANGELPVSFNGGAGLLLETFRVSGAGAGTVGDTAALVPKYITKIMSVVGGPAVSNATTSGTTNVTLTLIASIATNVTFDAWVIGKREG